jgi:hypothetical protein
MALQGLKLTTVDDIAQQVENEKLLKDLGAAGVGSFVGLGLGSYAAHRYNLPMGRAGTVGAIGGALAASPYVRNKYTNLAEQATSKSSLGLAGLGAIAGAATGPGGFKSRAARALAGGLGAYAASPLVKGVASDLKDVATDIHDHFSGDSGGTLHVVDPDSEAPTNLAEFIDKRPYQAALATAGLGGLTYHALGGHEGIADKVQAMKDNPLATAAGLGTAGVLSKITYDAMNKEANYQGYNHPQSNSMMIMGPPVKDTIYRRDMLGNVMPYNIKQEDDVNSLLKVLEAEKRHTSLLSGLGGALTGATAGGMLASKEPGGMSATAGALIGGLSGLGLGALLGYGGATYQQNLTKDLYGIRGPTDPKPAREKVSQWNPFSAFTDILGKSEKADENSMGPVLNDIREKLEAKDSAESSALMQNLFGASNDTPNMTPVDGSPKGEFDWLTPPANPFGYLFGSESSGNGSSSPSVMDKLKQKSQSEDNIMAKTDNFIDNYGGYMLGAGALAGLGYGGHKLYKHLTKESAHTKTALADFNKAILSSNLGGDIVSHPTDPYAYTGPVGTLAGTALGAYLGDKNLRSAGISGLGALAGGQLGSNLGLVGLEAMRHLYDAPNTAYSDKTYYNTLNVANLLGQLGGGAAAGHYSREKKSSYGENMYNAGYRTSEISTPRIAGYGLYNALAYGLPVAAVAGGLPYLSGFAAPAGSTARLMQQKAWGPAGLKTGLALGGLVGATLAGTALYKRYKARTEGDKSLSIYPPQWNMGKDSYIDSHNKHMNREGKSKLTQLSDLHDRINANILGGGMSKENAHTPRHQSKYTAEYNHHSLLLGNQKTELPDFLQKEIIDSKAKTASRMVGRTRGHITDMYDLDDPEQVKRYIAARDTENTANTVLLGLVGSGYGALKALQHGRSLRTAGLYGLAGGVGSGSSPWYIPRR